MNILTNQTLDKGNTPKDILMIRNLIESEGIEEYEKNTLNFVSEYLNSYIVDILSDSKQYALFADRHKINIDDVKMAVKLKQDTFYTKKPELELLKVLAKEVNSIQLSNIPDTPQILLPPPEHSLLRNNFQIYSEELLGNFANEQNKVENAETKLEEEFGITKRHSMIGLKRRDYDDRHNVVLSKKKMRLSHGAEDNLASLRAVTVAENFKVVNNIGHGINTHNGHKNNINFNENNEEHGHDNIFDQEEDDTLMKGGDNFLPNENFDMDEYNYDNAFS